MPHGAKPLAREAPFLCSGAARAMARWGLFAMGLLWSTGPIDGWWQAVEEEATNPPNASCWDHPVSCLQRQVNATVAAAQAQYSTLTTWDMSQPSLDAPGHVVVGRGLVGIWPELGQRADWVLNDPEDRAADGGLRWAPLLPIVSLAALLLGDRDHPDRGPWSFSNRADALLLQSKGTEMLSSNTL